MDKNISICDRKNANEVEMSKRREKLMDSVHTVTES